jgi:hypothetical protein
MKKFVTQFATQQTSKKEWKKNCFFNLKTLWKTTTTTKKEEED